MSVIISAVLPPFPKGIFSHERQRHDFPGVPLKSSLFNEFRAGSVCPLGIWVCIWGPLPVLKSRGIDRSSHSENLAARHSSSVLSNLRSLMNCLFCSAYVAVKYNPCPGFEVLGQGRVALEVQRKSRRKFSFSLRPFPWQLTDTQDLSRRWLPCCEIYGSNVASIKCPRKWSISLRCICWVHTLYLLYLLYPCNSVWIYHGYGVYGYCMDILFRTGTRKTRKTWAFCER